MFFTKGLEYYIPFAISIVAIFCFVFFCTRKFKNSDEHKKLLPVRIVFFVLLGLEIIKITLLIAEDNMFKVLRFPIVFCSLAMYAYPLFAFKKTPLATVGKTFAIIPALLAGLMFFILPGDLFIDTPTRFFVNCHSFFFHGAIVAVALYLMTSGAYKFKFNDHFVISAGLAAYLAFCMVLSIFISKDISLFGPNSSYLKWLFGNTGYATGIFAIMIFFYGLSFVIYKSVDLVQRKKAKANANG